jgi:hypothetical protein
MAVKSIKDINDRFQYDDKVSGGNGDGEQVSCGQHGTYNELSYIYKTFLKPLVEAEKITEQQALDAMDTACDLGQPREREDYYTKLEQLLGVKIR